MIWLDSAQAEQLGLKAQRILNTCTHGCLVLLCFALYLPFYSCTINGLVFGKKNKRFKWAGKYKNRLSLKKHSKNTLACIREDTYICISVQTSKQLSSLVCVNAGDIQRFNSHVCTQRYVSTQSCQKRYRNRIHWALKQTKSLCFVPPNLIGSSVVNTPLSPPMELDPPYLKQKTSDLCQLDETNQIWASGRSADLVAL